MERNVDNTVLETFSSFFFFFWEYNTIDDGVGWCWVIDRTRLLID